MLKRLRVDTDAKMTLFTLHNYETPEEPEYRIEIKVHSEEEIQRYLRDGSLIGVRMYGHPADRNPQTSSISPEHIEGLSRPEGYCDELEARVRQAVAAGEKHPRR